MELKAVIFDLDGTVIADEDEYGEAFAKVMQQFGIKLTSKYPHIGGIGVGENWDVFIKKFDIKTDKTNDELGTETQKEYLKLIPKITLKPGFVEFAEWMRNSEVIVALATSNYWSAVDKLFDHLGIEKYFDFVTTGDEVKSKKPNPEVFDITAEKMGIATENCLVLEDSSAGIDAARKAEMKVIAIARNEKHKKSLKRADYIIADFREI